MIRRIGKVLAGLRVEAGLVLGVWAMVWALGHPARVAESLGMDPYPWANRVFFAAAGGACAAMCVLVCRLARRLWIRMRRAARTEELAFCERGVLLAEFTLALPTIAVAILVIVQLALIVHAAVVVRYAAFCAARTAIVSFRRHPDLSPIEDEITGIDEDGEVAQSAIIVLASISPMATTGVLSIGDAAMQIHAEQAGPWGTSTLAERCYYSRYTTFVTVEVEYPPSDFDFSAIPEVWPGRQVTVTVRYVYRLSVPGIAYLLPGLGEILPDKPGVPGFGVTLEQRVRMQSTGAREGPPGVLLDGSGVI